MKNIIIVVVGALLVVFVLGWMKPEPAPVENIPEPIIDDFREGASQVISLKGVELYIHTPTMVTPISSPLTIKGHAPGNWFFEANAGLTLTDWDGLIIAEGYVMADGEWMTTDYVPFTGTLNFTTPFCQTEEYCKRGTVIFKKDNPSGLPEHDDAAEMTIKFE